MFKVFSHNLKGMKKQILILFSFCILGACTVNSGGSNVKVIVSPFGRGQQVISSRPVIYLHNGERQICRGRPYLVREARNILANRNMTKDFLDDFFPLEEGQGANREAEGGSNNRNNDPVRMDVGSNWLKFGLNIQNGTERVTKSNEEKNFFLIVHDIAYSAVGLHKGRRVGTVNGTISSGFCSSSEGGGSGGTPFLYFIPPGTSVRYRPLSTNPFENLTLFISGFDIIDRSEEASPRLQSLGAGVAGAEGAGGAGAESQPGQQAGSANSYGPDEIIIIPDYTVELVLRGYFMTNKGELVSEFVKRVRFQTQSSFRNF